MIMILFAVEVLARAYAHRRQFLTVVDIFDALIVVISLVSLFFVRSVTFLVVGRLLRVLRVLRIVLRFQRNRNNIIKVRSRLRGVLIAHTSAPRARLATRRRAARSRSAPSAWLARTSGASSSPTSTST